MDHLRQFTIPIQGLKIGIHEYNFLIGEEYFSHFEDSPIEQGTFEVKFLVDLQQDMLTLTFDFEGSIKTGCDRCLAVIDLPIEGDEDLIVKYAEESNDEIDIVYIERGTAELNVATYLYEYICLAMPVTNIYNCEDEPKNVCDSKMLDYLESKPEEQPAEKKEDNSSNSPWDELKNFNKN
jgi:uncharacterized protein